MKHRWSGLVLAALMASTVAAGPAAADEMTNEAGLGALAAVSTLVYAPVKLVYATCGLVFGGIAWGLSGGDSDVMMAVVTPAVRGDYVITPSHLRMEKSVEFFGKDPAYREAQDQQVASGASSSSTSSSDESVSHEDF